MKQKRTLPPEIPQIELYGSARAVIGDCDGIMEYEPETVKLRVGKRCVRICGSGLTLCDLADGAVMVCGRLMSLEYEG